MISNDNYLAVRVRTKTEFPLSRIFTLTLAFLIFAGAVNAINVGSLSVTPEVWLGDPVNVTAVCVNGTADRAYTDISNPEMILPSLDMTSAGGGAYTLAVPGNYFVKRGAYTATVTCAANVTANASTGFLISEMKFDIISVSAVYEQDIAEIVVLPKKNDVTITSGVTFIVMLDGAATAPSIPPIYETARGWVLRVSAPSAKTYALTVTTSYQGKSISSSRNMEVKPVMDFSISSDKSSVQKGDNMTLTVRALKKGSVISLDNLAVRINGVSANVLSNLQSGTSYTVKIAVPELTAGRYTLVAEITNNATPYTAYMNVSYFSVISGKVTGSMSISFSKSGAEILRLDTLSDGSYSGQIIPDTYDVAMETIDAKIKITGANVNVVSNPITYSYRPLAVEGFTSSGIYQTNAQWSFSSATLKLKYDGAIETPTVFRCDLWTGSKCAAEWAELTSSIDTGTNTATFTVSSLATFIIGKREPLKVFLNFDKKKYALKDIINIRGSVMTGSSPAVNASLRLKIDGTYIDHTIYTNQNGAFNLDFVGPDGEGNYTMKVTAKKQPYVQYDGNYNLEIINMPSFSVVFPATVQVTQGNKTVADVFIVNTGQSEITGLAISTDLDGKYYSVGKYPDRLGMKQDAHVSVTFYPGDVGTSSARLTVTANEFAQEKTFGFTTLAPPPKTVTGLAVALPEMNDTMIIAAFAAIAFSAAFMLKRLKGRNSFRRPKLPALHEVKNYEENIYSGSNSEYLNGIKEHLNRRMK